MAKKICLAVISVGLIYLLYACGDQEAATTNKVIASLAISPTSSSLTVGSTETFSAIATYTSGAQAAVVPVWTSTGSLGVITTVGYAGLFTARTPGSGEVIASAGGFSAEAAVLVTLGPTPEPGGLTTIEVSPTFANLPSGATQIFSATGINNSGEVTSISPSWSISGSSVGTFTFSGTTATLEATSNGKAFVSCTSGEVVTTVPVTVEGAVVSLTAESDTYVDENQPTIPQGGQTTLKAGYVLASGKHFEAYLKFNLGILPAGVSIESAAIQLYASAADSVAFQLYDLNSAFDLTTTWNAKPTDGSLIQSASFTAGQYNSVTSDALLTQVRAWYAAPAANFGLAIRQDAVAAGSAVTILSKENGANPPVLNIQYK